jgi:hypothetical protein
MIAASKASGRYPIMKRNRQGFMERHREGEAATRARNLAEAQQTLEGPGSERRLARVQAGFRDQGRALDHRPLKTIHLVLMAAVVFVLVLTVGLCWH